MASDINLIFEEIRLLISWKKAYEDDGALVQNLCLSNPTPRIVPGVQEILNAVPNVEIMHSVPWGGWLLTLCSRLIEAMEDMEDVASVTNLATFRGAVSKLISFSILPHLNCELPYPSEYMNVPILQLTYKQKLVVIDIVTRVLVKLLSNGHTRGGVLQYYGALLGALISIHGKSKAVNKSLNDRFEESSNEDRTDDASRQFYQSTVTHLLDDVHQPTVFTHLMILNTVKGDGGKVSRVACRVLESKIQQNGGVAALLNATVMSDQISSSTQDIIRISSLLSGKHSVSFYQSVLPQVLSLLKLKDTRGHQVVANCISLLNERDPDLCEQYLLRPLLISLESPCSEGDIESTVLSISRWVHAAPPNTNFSRPLPLICLLHTSLVNTPCALKANVDDLLVAILNNLELPCNFIISCCFPSHPGVSYILTPSCSVVSTTCLQSIPPETTSKLFLHFISERKLSKIKVDLYRSLLRYVLKEETPLDHKLISTELLTELSSDQDVLQSISSEPHHLIDFLLDLFSNEQSDPESISLGLVLLTVFLGDSLVHKRSNWEIIAKLKTPLLKLKKSSEFEIKTLAGEILLRLNDLGIIKVEGSSLNLSSASKKQENSLYIGKVTPGEYEEAIKESMDPHLPIRAHALRTLSKLLLANDKATLQNKSTILHLFKANLEDEDSFLYLSAIEGLSSLALVFPDDIINILCEEFLSRQSKPEVRLKIGQVIVKTTNLLGEMGAVYKRELLGTLLQGVRDPDPLVRASSLSNIGEMTKILSFRIYDYLIEIFDCVEKVVDTEKEVEPRRAAVMLITLLLQGLGQHLFTMLEEVLPDLYRKLKIIYQTDKDEVTKLHAQLALEQLADTTRGLLFPQQTLSKRISIIDINK